MKVALPAWRLLSPRGGVGNTLWHLLDQYATLAPDDQYVVFHECAEPDLPEAANVRAQRVRVPLVQNNLTWSDLALPAAVRREGADLLHNVAYTLPARITIPAVVTVHDVSYLRHPDWFPARVSAYLGLGTRRAVRRATVVTDSEFSAGEVAELCDCEREAIRVVPLAAHERFRPVADPEPVRARLGLPERYLLYLGGVLRRRRVDRLIAAAAGLLERYDAHLVVAGPARGQLDVAAEAERFGIADRVKMIGYVADEDLPALYTAATCFAWPSIYEGFGLPPLEALACGTPTVVAEAGSLPEVVGDAALKVPDETGALAAALERLLGDHALRESLRRLGPEQAARFSWRRTAESMLDIYRATLAAGAR